MNEQFNEEKRKLEMKQQELQKIQEALLKKLDGSDDEDTNKEKENEKVDKKSEDKKEEKAKEEVNTEESDEEPAKKPNSANKKLTSWDSDGEEDDDNTSNTKHTIIKSIKKYRF